MASQQDKLEAGRSALKFFFNRSLQYDGSVIAGMSYSQFEAYLDSLPHITESVRENLGGSILFAELDRDFIQDAMEKLADEYQGRLPDLAGSRNFNEALLSEFHSISYVTSVVKTATVETAKEVAGYAALGVGAWLIAVGVGAAIFLGRK